MKTTARTPSFEDLATPLLALASQERVRGDEINERSSILGFAFLLIHYWDDLVYVDLARGHLRSGVVILHILAKSNPWIAKAQRIALQISSDKTMKMGVYDRTFGETATRGGVVPTVAFTLVRRDLMKPPPNHGWSAKEVAQWQASFGLGTTVTSPTDVASVAIRLMRQRHDP